MLFYMALRRNGTLLRGSRRAFRRPGIGDRTGRGHAAPSGQCGSPWCLSCRGSWRGYSMQSSRRPGGLAIPSCTPPRQPSILCNRTTSRSDTRWCRPPTRRFRSARRGYPPLPVFPWRLPYCPVFSISAVHRGDIRSSGAGQDWPRACRAGDRSEPAGLGGASSTTRRQHPAASTRRRVRGGN
jgi:hypothetical protein